MADPAIINDGPDFQTALAGLSARLDDVGASLLTRIDNDHVAAKTAVRDVYGRIAELEHDLTALATLLGTVLGEPFKSQAAEIVSKRQTAEED